MAVLLLADLGHRRAERVRFIEYRIEDAAATLQSTALLRDAALRFREHVAKHDARACLSGQLDAVGTVRQRVPLIAHFDGRVSR